MGCLLEAECHWVCSSDGLMALRLMDPVVMKCINSSNGVSFSKKPGVECRIWMNLNHNMILFVIYTWVTMKSCFGHPRCQRMLLWNLLENVIHTNYTIFHDEKLHDVLVTPQARVLTKNCLTSHSCAAWCQARFFLPMEPKVVRWRKGSFVLWNSFHEESNCFEVPLNFESFCILPGRVNQFFSEWNLNGTHSKHIQSTYSTNSHK